MLSKQQNIARVILAAISWFAVFLQFRIMINSGEVTGLSKPMLAANFFSYFTILSNLLVAISLSYQLNFPRSKPGQFFPFICAVLVLFCPTGTFRMEEPAQLAYFPRPLSVLYNDQRSHDQLVSLSLCKCREPWLCKSGAELPCCTGGYTDNRICIAGDQ